MNFNLSMLSARCLPDIPVEQSAGRAQAELCRSSGQRQVPIHIDKVNTIKSSFIS